MNYSIYITRSAENDLNESADYIKFALKNPDAAERLLDLVSEHIEVLASNPGIYPVVDDAVLQLWGIRFVPVNNHLAFYRADEESEHIYILRFLYGKRDWISILRQSIKQE